LEDFLLEQSQRAEFTEVEGRENLQELISAVAAACKEISSEIDAEPLRKADLARGGAKKSLDDSAAVASVNATGDVQKELDVRANDIFLKALQQCPSCALAASEEETETIELNTALDDGVQDKFAVVFDPIDGSSNIECSIPTGTIFGVYRHDPSQGVMQSGANLVAAGYTLYSSSTILVLTLGEGTGTHGFTMDRSTGRFILTHPNMKIPSRGQIYSLNDARYYDWPQGLREYIDSIRRGEGETGKQYSARYVCSLVADVHRTLMYGGVAMNPRFHLRLVYEGAPMAKVIEQAGGRGMDGIRPLLSIVPEELHQKTPVFLGSPEDIQEMLSFSSRGGIQQTSAKKYEV
jgi:fructose-1,6-bisphosphatase I